MTGHGVVIVGAGPTGLTLAGELALAGVDVAILERREDQELTGSRAGGLHSRTLELFDQRGIVDRFLAEGQTAQVAGFAWIRLDISDFPTPHPYGLALWQNRIERILADRVAELGVPVRRGSQVTAVTQDARGVRLTLADGEAVRAEYAVGCDGGSSTVRRAAAIDFPGWDASTRNLIAEVQMVGEPEWGLRRDQTGIHGLSPMETGDGRVRVMLTEQRTDRTGDPTLDDLREELIAIYGRDFGVHSPTWISRFTDAARQAAEYRRGRVLLAGDAAHIHYPVGGQGLNLGVHDAMNLGWKLAQVVRGTSPETLLDSYHAERYPVAAAVLRDTMAQVALLRTDDRTEALREITGEMLALDGPRRQIAGRMSGLDIRYGAEGGHPLLGRRMPCLELQTSDGPATTFSLLHDGRPCLLVLDDRTVPGVGSRSERVRCVVGRYDGSWELPVVGAIRAPAAVLVRPDGYVAWVGEGSADGLSEALGQWFGQP